MRLDNEDARQFNVSGSATNPVVVLPFFFFDGLGPELMDDEFR